ncbi:hypothetical protein H5410_048026 [Solanum commersonii]|uniref:Uncharacterized protein n=1 Tax=Solanum commersonii TaxID=4109 RepID=A0A9J5XKQ1_SOLCO|nr:hypothetical protein H5410_048026 [Solanum commersonii]
MPEENNMKKISETDLTSLDGENIVLKKGMEALKLSDSVYATNTDKALAKEQEAVKKC